MDVNLSSEERAQILQTIEMFEVITQTQPDDCQSLDILKEAYVKIGQQNDALRVARRLAEAYLQSGLYSSALLECEGILLKDPTAADVLALMGEIESRMGLPSSARAAAAPPASSAPPSLDPATNGQIESPEAANLMQVPRTKRLPGQGAPVMPVLPEEDGNGHFASFLAHHRMVTEPIATAAFQKIRFSTARRSPGSMTPAPSLLEEIARDGGPAVDLLLGQLVEITKSGYVPLENYDLDRAIVRLLPETLTIGRLLVPFDVVSRTVMIALCNPFDAAAKEAAASQLDYHIQWYLAKPASLVRVLRDVYRLDAAD